jgi:hypothetical protein
MRYSSSQYGYKQYIKIQNEWNKLSLLIDAIKNSRGGGIKE